MAENKVCFNLKNVHYAKITSWTNGVPTYATPVRVAGAVSVSLSPNSSTDKFYADGSKYFVTINNDGYSGDLEMARFPDTMLKDIWNFSEGATSKVLTESNSTEPNHFALLFEIDGDADEQLYAFYDCVGSRPAVNGSTNTENKDIKTQTSSVEISPLGNGTVMARTTNASPAATKSSWFTTVFVEQ